MRHPVLSHRFAAIVMALLALTLLVACDESGDETPETASATGTTSATTATATAAPPSSTPTSTATEGPATTATVPSEPVASTAWIPVDQLPEVRFTADGVEAVLPVEVPPQNEYTIGLSGRTELGERGMFFYYPPGEHTGSFWMRNTHIDLDIAFVDANFEVVAVLQMQADTLDRHSPGQPYLAAIEAPLGWYEAHGIDAGAQVEFLFDIDEYLP